MQNNIIPEIIQHMRFDVNVQRVRNSKIDTRKTCRYQRGNENMLFDDGQTIQ